MNPLIVLDESYRAFFCFIRSLNPLFDCSRSRIFPRPTMPPPSKRKQQTNNARDKKKRNSISKAATYKHNQRELQQWTSELLVLKSSCKNLCSHNGKIYTLQENILLICAIVGCLERRLKDGSTITWTSIDREVSSVFHVSLSHIVWLRELFINEGKI